MAKREEDLSAYAQKQLIIAFAPIGNSSDTYYNANLTEGNRKTRIDASYSIGVGIFKPEGENARVIGYLDGDVIKILGNCTMKNYQGYVSYMLKSIDSDTVPSYTVARYPDKQINRG